MEGKNMMKKILFCETNGYDMIVSVDGENNCRYLTETDEFPILTGLDAEQKVQSAKRFLESVEDDSSWDDDCTYEQIFIYGVNVIVEIEKEI